MSFNPRNKKITKKKYKFYSQPKTIEVCAFDFFIGRRNVSTSAFDLNVPAFLTFGNDYPYFPKCVPDILHISCLSPGQANMQRLGNRIGVVGIRSQLSLVVPQPDTAIDNIFDESFNYNLALLWDKYPNGTKATYNEIISRRNGIQLDSNQLLNSIVESGASALSKIHDTVTSPDRFVYIKNKYGQINRTENNCLVQTINKRYKKPVIISYNSSTFSKEPTNVTSNALLFYCAATGSRMTINDSTNPTDFYNKTVMYMEGVVRIMFINV